MLLFPAAMEFTEFVQSVVNRFGAYTIAQTTGIPIEDLQRWHSGENHYYPQAEWLIYGFCVNRRAFDLLGPNLPAFDKRKEEFEMDSPPLGYDIEPPHYELHKRPRNIAGFEVDFPFGISASVLTRNSKAVAFYADRGFDILTYKTVRSVRRDPHPAPTWTFIRSKEITPPFEETVIGDPNYWPEDPFEASMANSFGIPSQTPKVWQEDVGLAKKSLRSGQILIVSVVASPDPSNTTEEEITRDFVRVASMAKEAGADIVEANFSCPNTPKDPTGLLYHDAEMSGRVSAAIRRAIGTTPLLVKIGYLNKIQLSKFVQHNREQIRGIVAINTISMPVISAGSGNQLFPGTGRLRAGISGYLIRPWAMSVVRDLVEIRYRERAENEFAIIGVGGVSTPRDVYDYLNLGADAVETCTTAYVNPYIAIQTRLQLIPEESAREVRVMSKEQLPNQEESVPELEPGHARRKPPQVSITQEFIDTLVKRTRITALRDRLQETHQETDEESGQRNHKK